MSYIYNKRMNCTLKLHERLIWLSLGQMLLIFNLVYLFVKWMNIFAFFLRRIKARVFAYTEFVGPFSEHSLIICDFSIDRKFVLILFYFRNKCTNAYFYALIWTILPFWKILCKFWKLYYLLHLQTLIFSDMLTLIMHQEL